jgi:predicted TIM-barrel fold metal-dependent hydrolase
MNEAARTVLGVAHSVPTFAAPPGSCDCHVHIFGPDEKFPLSPKRTYRPGPASIEDLNALHRALGIERVVVVHPSPYGADNAVTLDAVRKLGPTARGVAVIDETTSEAALDELHDAGFRGARVNLESHGVSDPAAAGRLLQRAAERVARLGWHVQTYTTLAILAALHDAILKLPVTLVIDHFGRAQAALGVAQPGFAQLLALLRSGKVYVKISGDYRVSHAADYADAAPLARAMIEANPDRVVWGTDWPHPGGNRRDPDLVEPFLPQDDGRALNRLAEWTRGADELRKILVDNPARLYGF